MTQNFRVSPIYLSLTLSLALSAPSFAQLGTEALLVPASKDGQDFTPDVIPSDFANLGAARSKDPAEGELERSRRRLEESSRLLARALRSYAALFVLADNRTLNGRNRFYFGDKGKYRQGERRADELSADLIEVSNALDEVERLVARMEPKLEPAWVLEQKCEWTRQATVYNGLLRWGRARAMKYNGPKWGDSETRETLVNASRLRFQRLPRSSGNRPESILSPSLMEPVVDRSVRAGLDLIDVARAARDDLESFKKNRRDVADPKSFGWNYLDFEDDQTFDRSAEPAAIRFSLAVLQAKAHMNAAILAAEGPNLHSSEKSHNDVRRLILKLVPLATYGDTHYLRVRSSWGFVTREAYLFEGGGFRKQDWISTSGRETEYLRDVMKYFKTKSAELDVFLD